MFACVSEDVLWCFLKVFHDLAFVCSDRDIDSSSAEWLPSHSTLVLDDSPLGELSPQEKPQGPVTPYAFSAQSELPV